MNKRKDAQIYIVAHKPLDYGIWDNSLYTPIQVGTAERFLDFRDSDVTPNISEWNNTYAELTGLYSIWKGTDCPVVGFCQYRRRIEVPEDFNFDNLFDKFDVGVGSALRIGSTLAQQYEACHAISDINFLRDIVAEKYPDYLEDYDKHIMYGNIILYSNGRLMKRDLFNESCEFIFSLLEEFRKRKGWEKPEDVEEEVSREIAKRKRHGYRGLKYQSQVLAFLSERLWTLWVMHGNKRIFTIPYKLYEGLDF